MQEIVIFESRLKDRKRLNLDNNYKN